MFSIIIPTWNNLPYLQLCVESIRKYSSCNHEIVIHVNDGSDGTLDWVRAQGIRYSHSEKNIGVCLAVNHLVAQASHDWVLYMNDDMVACPGWDVAFDNAILSTGTDLALFFGTQIELRSGTHPNRIYRDFGGTPENFREAELVLWCQNSERKDYDGAASQPTLVHKKWWLMLGGYSLEFSPGMSSDDDLLMKFWIAGCRHFKVVGGSKFYHFCCKSTERIRHNRGGRIFAMKWGITQREFFHNYLASLANVSTEPEQNFPRGTLLGKLRRVGYGLLHTYPLEDIGAWDTQPGVTNWESGG